jgi:hypothetical protein
MNKKFLALAKADIQERIPIKDELIDAYLDPVYENGMQFSGEVLVIGTVNDDTDEETLGAILQDYLREYVEFARVRKVSFQGEKQREPNTYRRAG